MNILAAKVIKVLKSGLLIRIEDGNRQGFVPKREYIWDRRVGADIPHYNPGDSIEVIQIEADEKKGENLFSIKQTTNPWEENTGKYEVGQHVRGEVVNVQHFGAFVQIEPGIDGMVWPKDMPLFDAQTISEALSIGDTIQAEIIELDPDSGQMELSINKYLDYLDEHHETRTSLQLDIFKESYETCKKQKTEEYNSEFIRLPAPIRKLHKAIPFPRKILIVDDDPEEQNEIESALRQAYEHPAYAFGTKEKDTLIEVIHKAKNGAEVDQFIQKNKYGLAVLDYHLAVENGVQIAAKILDIIPDIHILFTSDDFQAEIHVRKNFGSNVIFSDKSPGSIISWFHKLVSGYEEEDERYPIENVFEKDRFIQSLEMGAFANQDLNEKLKGLLESLVKETQVKYAFIMEVDTAKKQVGILAKEGIGFPLDYDYDFSTELFYSPVQEVIENEAPFYETSITDEPRFKYFFRFLDFNTGYGIPLNVPGIPLKHALFVLDKKKMGETFSLDAIQHIKLTGSYVQVALERDIILDFMRRYEQRYFIGEIKNSLVHEIRGQLNGTTAKQATLTSYLKKAKDHIGTTAGLEFLGKAITCNKELSELQKGIEELVDAYSRLAKGALEKTNLNSTVSKIARQLQDQARAANVTIYPMLREDLSEVMAIPSRVEEVLGNIVMNAIQQIEAQAERFGKKASAPALLQKGCVMIQTNRCDANNTCQIIVTDTGPGIPFGHKKRIFELGVSSRKEGYGMGLYIGKNLTEFMGGKLYLLDSILFIGSVFVIEFSVPKTLRS